MSSIGIKKKASDHLVLGATEIREVQGEEPAYLCWMQTLQVYLMEGAGGTWSSGQAGGGLLVCASWPLAGYCLLPPQAPGAAL